MGTLLKTNTMISINKHLKVWTLSLLLLLAANPAFAAGKKLSPELEEKRVRLESVLGKQPSGELIDVIVQTRAGASLSQHRKKWASLGAKNKSNLDIINGSVYRIPASMLPQ